MLALNVSKGQHTNTLDLGVGGARAAALEIGVAGAWRHCRSGIGLTALLEFGDGGERRHRRSRVGSWPRRRSVSEVRLWRRWMSGWARIGRC